VKLSGIKTLTPIAISGIWWRSIQTRFIKTPLQTKHTKTATGRFHYGTKQNPGWEVIYLSENHFVSQFEVDLILGSATPGQTFVPNPSAIGWSFFPVTVNASSIVDLTSPAEIAKIETSIQELTGDWKGYEFRPFHPLQKGVRPIAPTQHLAYEMEKTGLFEGLLTWSSRIPDRKNLVLFPKQKQSANIVEYDDPISGKTLRLS
jgi:hypothetical protein